MEESAEEEVREKDQGIRYVRIRSYVFRVWGLYIELCETGGVGYLAGQVHWDSLVRKGGGGAWGIYVVGCLVWGSILLG